MSVGSSSCSHSNSVYQEDTSYNDVALDDVGERSWTDEGSD